MMIRLDSNGTLNIKRKSKFKAMKCPYKQASMPCGDHCPLFEEPVYDQNINSNHEQIRLRICDKQFYLHEHEFEDLRT